MNQYHITLRGQQSGPYQESELQAMLVAGTVAPNDLCWAEGMTDWRSIYEIIQWPANLPPPPPDQIDQPPYPAPHQFIGHDAGIRMLLPVGRSGWAIAAGYLGLFGLAIVPAPLALIISIVAIMDIRKSKTTGKPKHGMGRAVFGIIVGIVGTLVLLGMLLL